MLTGVGVKRHSHGQQELWRCGPTVRSVKLRAVFPSRKRNKTSLTSVREKKCVRIVARGFSGFFSREGGDENNGKKKNSAERQATGKEKRNLDLTNKSRKQIMLDFVNELMPSTDLLSHLELPPTSIVAIRQTVNNLIGTLPPEYFQITISSREENLAQLMYSVLMTGYMFCNAHHRLELAKRLDMASPRGGTYVQHLGNPEGERPRGFLPDVTLVKKRKSDGEGESLSESTDDESVDYEGQDAGVLAAGTQKIGVQGDILRWHYEHGVQQVTAEEYIQQLEEEIAALRKELASSRRLDAVPQLGKYVIGETNAADTVERDAMESEILAFLKTLSPERVSELTDCASTDVMQAMNALVERLIGSEDNGGIWISNRSECTSSELGQILCWLMAIGHELRDLEIRTSLNATLHSVISFGPDDGADEFPSSSDIPGLPPGR